MTEYFKMRNTLELSLKYLLSKLLGTGHYLISFNICIFFFFFCDRKMGVFLNFKNLQTCLRDAILLDYYVSGFCWAKEMNFSIDQYSKFMTLLDMLLHNLQSKCDSPLSF